MDLFFTDFLKAEAPQLNRIAGATRGELTKDELPGEVLLAADEIALERGHKVDFSSPGDKETIFGKLWKKWGKWKNGKDRYAVRLDLEIESEDSGAVKLLDRLVADKASDPVFRLILLEEAADADLRLAESYSQAAAYVAVFYCFKYDRQKISAYLVISDGTLMARVRAAVKSVRAQSSLFDGIERIGESFMPIRGRELAPKIRHEYVDGQCSWIF